jgi:N-acetylmuramoyl-L-alanine amidase
MRIVGKYGNDYKVELAAGKTAFIEEKYITLLPRGFILPPVLTSKITVQGDSLFDYIKMALPRRLPYESRQLLQPAAIEIDLYGAVNNTNWITQLASAKEVERVEYRQVSDEVFRITVYLNHQQHWGHSIYYENNTLVVRIKHQPNPEIKNLIIAIDAGHGGRNTGAQGLTGAIEKNICLDIALKLQKQLEEHGAKVIMTRTTERFFDNLERILFYRDSLPDLLISIHLNGSADPVNASGTMMFYRYPGFKSLNEAIYKRMQELGLKPNGITSSFNFMLNSPTEYPNALVEALFLSNPADEERVLQEAFREEMAKKIVAGIKDFLESCRKE